jgi:hypothetical protein
MYPFTFSERYTLFCNDLRFRSFLGQLAASRLSRSIDRCCPIVLKKSAPYRSLRLSRNDDSNGTPELNHYCVTTFHSDQILLVIFAHRLFQHNRP